MDMQEKILLRPVEAAELIGVSRSKIYELLAAGLLPVVRVGAGRLMRVPMAALRALAETASNATAGGDGDRLNGLRGRSGASGRARVARKEDQR
jgi:excisionase family DNA binding protein